MAEPKGHPLKDAIRQENDKINAAYDADVDRRTQVIKDSLSDLGKELKAQATRFGTEVWDQFTHSLGHGATELASALYTQSAFVQYGAAPSEVALGDDAPKIEAPKQDEPKQSMSL